MTFKPGAHEHHYTRETYDPAAKPNGADPAPEAGAAILADVYAFIGRFVAYPSEHAHVAHTLWLAHTHAMNAWESTPRIAFLSPEPGSGKSRALEVSNPLVPRPVEAINVTPSYLFRKVSGKAGRPTILFDEIDTVFGPRAAKDNEETRGLLNAGHRRGAVAGRCVVRGKIVETEELPAYCAVAVAGLGDLPDTIMTRSVIVRMRRRKPDEPVEPWRNRVNAPEGEALRARLAAWAATVEATLTAAWPTMPESLVDRHADVWEALLAIADEAGGDWPGRARVAAVALVAASSAGGPTSLGVKLLSDVRDCFGDRYSMSTADLLAALLTLPESVWLDIKGKSVSALYMARLLRRYDVKPKVLRVGEATPRGYTREDLADAWDRYLGPPA